MTQRRGPVEFTTALHFDIGGYFADGIDVRLSRRRLLCQRTEGPFPTGSPASVRPTEEQWQQFWNEIDRIGVWTWLPKYDDSDIVDGVQWTLSLAHEGRKVECYGSNQYPGSDSDEIQVDGPFADFLRALAVLAQNPPIAEV